MRDRAAGLSVAAREGAEAMLEGSRTFDIVFGLVSGGGCFATALPLLIWSLKRWRVAFFDRRVDPSGHLQLAYGFFGMGMFGTDIGCRWIDHGTLEFVHPAFAAITLLYVVGIAPRVIRLALARRGHTVVAA